MSVENKEDNDLKQNLEVHLITSWSEQRTFHYQKQFERYTWNQERALSEMPNVQWRRDSEVSCSIVSKAAERSNNDSREV